MVYLDNAATTYPKYFAWDWSSYWLNSNAPYAHGSKALLDGARENIKKALGVKSGKMLFCRSATEAVEWLTRQRHLSSRYTSRFEHDSVLWMPTDVNMIHEYDTIDIYLHQHTNQMTGEIFNIKAIEERLHKYDRGYAFFGSDFTATIGHAPIPKDLDDFCDAVWFSGHKFHVEKGIGAIWLSDRLFEYLGGSEDSRNEYGLIHGTVNVPAAIALSYGMMDAVRWYEDGGEDYFTALASEMFHQLREGGIDYTYVNNTRGNVHTDAINAIILPNINADALQTYLASKQIYIGVGHSACADVADYRVLKAYGLGDEDCRSTVRVSFNMSNTRADIVAFVQGIKEFKEKYYGSC